MVVLGKGAFFHPFWARDEMAEPPCVSRDQAVTRFTTPTLDLVMATSGTRAALPALQCEVEEGSLSSEPTHPTHLLVWAPFSHRA